MVGLSLQLELKACVQALEWIVGLAMVLWEGENWGWLLAIIEILSCGRRCSPFIITDDNESKINV